MKHNRLKNFVMSIGSLVAFIPFVVHAAGVIQLPETGQTKCYDTAGRLLIVLEQDRMEK